MEQACYKPPPPPTHRRRPLSRSPTPNRVTLLQPLNRELLTVDDVAANLEAEVTANGARCALLQRVVAVGGGGARRPSKNWCFLPILLWSSPWGWWHRPGALGRRSTQAASTLHHIPTLTKATHTTQTTITVPHSPTQQEHHTTLMWFPFRHPPQWCTDPPHRTLRTRAPPPPPTHTQHVTCRRQRRRLPPTPWPRRDRC